ncbi:coproporphyrinogen III oxidase family protein [Methanophagales archaeon]|nr:MAG: coproporphyrinogen III oxidase family protein [Methanophagales archaeon]
MFFGNVICISNNTFFFLEGYMESNNTRKWLKSHHDTLFPFFPYLEKKRIEWLFDRLEQKGAEKGALYVHIPFCSGKCTFCILTKELPSHSLHTTKYVNSVLEEASAWSDYFSPVETVYIGGGTPTSLSSEDLKLLFMGLKEHFQIEPDAEISVETTVSKLTEAKMKLLVELGVNRLSVGVQTFNRGLRKTLGRRGSSKEVIEKLNTVRAFFPLLSIDLLYDIPGQGKTDVITDVQKAIEIGIDGISVYPLIYSPKTAISKKFEPPPIETAKVIFGTVKSFLEDNGYRHLNINHFTNGRDKFQYSTYFNRLANVLGLGAGATGFVADCFLKHPSTSEKYIQSKNKNTAGNVFNVPVNVIPVLWCVSQIQYGRIDIETPRREWDFEPLDTFSGTLKRGVDRGELIIAKDTIELTSEGMFWANTIGAEMAVECLYNGKGNLVSLEESTAKIAKAIMLNKLRLRLV